MHMAVYMRGDVYKVILSGPVLVRYTTVHRNLDYEFAMQKDQQNIEESILVNAIVILDKHWLMCTH